MYRTLAELAPPEDAAGYADLARHLNEDPAFRRRFMTLRFQAALVTNTLTVTVLEGSSRTNVLPLEAVAHIDARLLPGESCERFTQRIGEAIADPGISTEVLLSFEDHSSSADTPLYAAIEAIAARSDPPAHTVPSVTIGFTDAHYFRRPLLSRRRSHLLRFHTPGDATRRLQRHTRPRRARRHRIARNRGDHAHRNIGGTRPPGLSATP